MKNIPNLFKLLIVAAISLACFGAAMRDGAFVSSGRAPDTINFHQYKISGCEYVVFSLQGPTYNSGVSVSAIHHAKCQNHK